MNFILLIHQGTTPVPPSREWDELGEQEKAAIHTGYMKVTGTPGVTPGLRMAPPASATTVRVRDGKTITTDGPFAETKEALGGYLIFEAADLDSAIELASLIPAARIGGAVEVRPLA